MIRSVLAVLGGFAVMAVVVMAATVLAMRAFIGRGMPAAGGGAMPAPGRAYLTANLIASGIAALAGGCVTALIARQHALAHGVALAALMVVMSAASMRQAGTAQPRWYQLTLMTVMPLLALAGAVLRGPR